MKIIEIPGLDQKKSRIFFNELNRVLCLKNDIVFLEWHKSRDNGLYLPAILNIKESLLNLIKNSEIEIWSKSVGSYLIIEALQALQEKRGAKGLRVQKVVIFGLPYRLSYPPDEKVLNSEIEHFDDISLVDAYLHELNKLKVPIIIFQGELDDLGPVDTLTERADKYPNIHVVRVPNEGHGLNPNALVKFFYRKW